MDNRKRVAVRLAILRTARKGRCAVDLTQFRRGVRRELRQLLERHGRQRTAAAHWYGLAVDMRREGWTDAARKALEYARTARLVAADAARVQARWDMRSGR